jgi:hypothetical protein
MSDHATASRTRWPTVALAVTAAAVTVSWAAVQAPRALGAHVTRCSTFKGKRLLRSRSVTVIERFEEEHRGYVFVCMPPLGRVYLAGNAYDEGRSGGFSVEVLRTAGSWVALEFDSSQDPHDGEKVDKTCDARNGHCYRFYQQTLNFVLEGPEGQTESAALETLALNGFGEMLLGERTTKTTKVIGVKANGSQTPLDNAPSMQIPLSSLKLVGHLAEWTDGGATRTATL